MDRKELSRILQDSGGDQTLRYRTAEKLVKLQDRTQNVRLAKCTSDFNKFLHEQRQKKKIDWKNRAASTSSATSSCPSLHHQRMLPKISSFPTSKTAEIAKALHQREAVRELNTEEKDININRNNNDDSENEDLDEQEREEEEKLRAFYQDLKQFQCGNLPKGTYSTEDEFCEEAQTDLWERKKRLGLQRLIEKSELKETSVGRDAQVQPGANFYKWIFTKATSEKLFSPTTLVVDTSMNGVAILLVNVKSKHKRHGRTTTRFHIPVPALDSPQVRNLLLGPLEKSTANQSGQPLFILKQSLGMGSGTSCRPLVTVDQVSTKLKELASNPPKEGCLVLQRYVRSSGRLPWFVRVVKNQTGKFEVFTFTSKTEFPQQNNWRAPEAAWLVDTKVNETDPPNCEVVYRTCSMSSAGTFKQAFQFIQDLTHDLASYNGVKFQQLAVDFVRTTRKTWRMIHVKAFAGLERQELSRPPRFKVLEPEELHEEIKARSTEFAAEKGLLSPRVEGGLEAVDAIEPGEPSVAFAKKCHGDYCSRGVSLKSFDARVYEVPYKVILFDRLSQQVAGRLELSKFDRENLLNDVNVCRMCMRVYKVREKEMQSRGGGQPERSACVDSSASSVLDLDASTLASMLADGSLLTATTPSKPKKKRKQKSAMTTKGSEAGSGEHVAQTNDQPGALPEVHLPYSTDMLALNSNIYTQMIQSQKRWLQQKKKGAEENKQPSLKSIQRTRSPGTPKNEKLCVDVAKPLDGAVPAEMLLPSPSEDFDLFVTPLQ